MINQTQNPLLFLDVDGVISLFGFQEGYGLATGDAPFDQCPPGGLHSINGVLHYISSGCAAHLERLGSRFELVWATGWEETANEYLPHLLGLPGELPCLSFDGRVSAGAAHWKLDAIEEYAGDRPAGLDRRLPRRVLPRLGRRNGRRRRCSSRRVRHEGMRDEHVELLLDWADELAARP